MSAYAFNIVKAGWLYRLSDVLKVWKREWAIIYVDGSMSFLKSQDRISPDKKLNLILECKEMKSYDEFESKIPDGKTKPCLFGFFNSDSTYWFCAEDEDDAMVWRLVLEQLVTTRPPNYPRRPSRPSSTPSYAQVPQLGAQNGYYYQTPYPINPVIHGNQGQGVLPQTIIQHPDGTQTVYVNGGVPYCYEHGCAMAHCHGCHYDGTGLGMAAGLTAGALMFSPFMWSPLFWC